MSNVNRLVLGLVLAGAAATGCSDDPSGPRLAPHDPATAPRVAIDRFGDGFATLFDRTETNGLPAPNAPVDFDQYPFITHGVGPDGRLVSYYNFDVLPDTPAPIYILFRQGEDTPVQGQLNIIDLLPGDAGYNDFWRVIRVTVPRDYVANTVASLEEIEDAGYPMEVTEMINPFEDNGIKIFSGRGEKLDENFEARIETLVADLPSIATAADAAIGHDPDLGRHYVAHLRQILSTAGPLADTRIVVDCANGATAPIAPDLFRSLGFEVQPLGDRPDGRNINLHCGSTHLELLRDTVLGSGARLGIAFDGDGDRALFVDRHGRTVDGDAVLLIAAEDLQRRGALRGGAIVATVMSNIGLELALRQRGIELVRAPVGDKYVMEEMLKRGLALGGEQSGHIILADHLFTGDGMATALAVLRIMADSGRELDELAAALVTYPQVLVNVRVRERADYMKIPAIASCIARVSGLVDGQGRVLIRYSGTEPLLRIMLEGKDDDEIRGWANEIADVVRAELG
jgi:phosphoglucosamine mutase